MYWIILSVFVWGLLHSFLASLKVKAFVMRLIGRSLGRFYRLVYNMLAFISFLPVVVIAGLTPDHRLYVVPLPWSALMVLGELLAVAILIVGLRQTNPREFLGLQQLMRPEIDQPSEDPLETAQGRLITAGVYHYVRHPLYSAGLVCIWLFPFMTVNLLSINIGLTLYIFVGAYFEERKLRSEFGKEYAEYAAVTPMFIPFPKGNKLLC